MYLSFLSSNGIYRKSHSTRFFANLKSILKNLQSVTTGKNVKYVSLPRHIKESALRENTTSEELAKIEEVAKILRKAMKSVSCQYKGSLKDSYQSCDFSDKVIFWICS